MKGVFLDRDTVDRGDLDFSRLESALPSWQFYDLSQSGHRQQPITDATVIISNKVVIDEAVFAAAPNLQLVCVAATGTNNVDLDAATRRGVVVSNVRAYATPSVTQHVFALILSLSTQLGKYRRAVMKGEWQRSPYFCLLDYPIHEIAGKTLGIIGYGELGKAVARIGEAFGMNVIIADHAGHSPRLGRVSFAELLGRADIISLHCPLTAETQHLIGADELSQMKQNALLINTARGGIVDEQALANALRKGTIAGAGFDVLSKEPPLDSNPLLADDIPNLIITPHIAWASRESRQRLIDQIAENILAFVAGTPRNQVN